MTSGEVTISKATVASIYQLIQAVDFALPEPAPGGVVNEDTAKVHVVAELGQEVKAGMKEHLGVFAIYHSHYASATERPQSANGSATFNAPASSKT